MFSALRSSKVTKILRDIDAFWRHVDANQQKGNTPAGPQADAEERLDLRMAESIKALLESRLGPEKGKDGGSHLQNWDWNDDRTRPIFMLRSAFEPSLIADLRALLEREFRDFRILILLCETWDSEEWGGLEITRDTLAVQRNVIETNAIAT